MVSITTSAINVKGFVQDLHQRDGLCTGVHSVHTGVLMANLKCVPLTWGHRPECTLFLRVIGQSAHFFLRAIDQSAHLFPGSSTRVHSFFKGHRSVCTHFCRPFHECAHIFHARHPDCVESAHIFRFFSCPAAPKFRIWVLRSGSWWVCKKGRGLRFIPSECQGCWAPAGAQLRRLHFRRRRRRRRRRRSRGRGPA
jgi:hypothetical protein